MYCRKTKNGTGQNHILYKSKDVSVANLILYSVLILIRNTRHLKANSGTVHGKKGQKQMSGHTHITSVSA